MANYYAILLSIVFEVIGATSFEFIMWAPFVGYNHWTLNIVQYLLIVQAMHEINHLHIDAPYIKYAYNAMFYSAVLMMNTDIFINAFIMFSMFVTHKNEYLKHISIIAISIVGITYYNTIMIGIIGRLVIDFILKSSRIRKN